jgi:UDP-N-acetylmuramate dehydrogenase
MIPPFLQLDHDITLLSAFKTPACARYFFDMHEHTDVEKLHEIYLFSQAKQIPLVIIGWGTNCLFAFDMFEGIIVRNRDTGWEAPFERDGREYIRIHSGEMSHFVAQKLYDHHWVSTLVPWIGLPGTFGGATIGNAGCFGVEMADVFVESEVLDIHTGEVNNLKKSDMNYSYRNSSLKWLDRYYVISTLIDLTPLGGEYETFTPENLKSIRKVKQPAGFSCGSFFMNSSPSDDQKTTLSEFLTPIGTLSSGRLIDQAGLKGTRVWGIKVSEQHGNFFINDAKATWQDVLGLRDLVKKEILEKYGIDLHEEVRIISN